ncbi:cytochrome D1 domain-containing protein [Candidatus Parabeggiatoa sp. HSG14]|uniref:cytochrome D1 domain-containing protein n=1 Tax=Candidatus Parabeggiatoa sp. HSG14 TaxID=3055593 RepID=UPI0025A7F074|nr:cytochrome D1 domain-containing protein [Thiotrichales bacterium HSG14]
MKQLLILLFFLPLTGICAEEIPTERQNELLHLLRHDCGSCHGMTLKGGLGPSLLPQALAAKPKSFLLDAILKGHPGTAMPPWQHSITKEEAAWLVEKLLEGVNPIETVNPAKTPPANGASLFFGNALFAKVSPSFSETKLKPLERNLFASKSLSDSLNKSVFSSNALLAKVLKPYSDELRGTGDLGVVVERAKGSILVVETTTHTQLAKIQGLGDLSHASIVYSRDQHYAYVFGRDGGLTKLDILRGKIVKRIIQAGNSIGGAISQNGRLVAVSNYTPGGVKVFDATTLELVADIPAEFGNNQRSKVVGLVDAPGQYFVFSLFDAGEIWIADMHTPRAPKIRKFKNIGRQPYDALISPDGRYYIAGLFGEDGLALLDLWHLEEGVQRILSDYGKGGEKRPVYKMPHLEGWAMAGNYAFIPAIGQHAVLVVDKQSWQQVKRIPVHGQPVFVMARPDSRQIWVNFAFPNNDTIQVIDVPTMGIVKTLKPGKATLHLEFTPRGEEVWISVRDEDKLIVYNTETFAEVATLPTDKPSGIFFTVRAHKIGL